MDNNRNVGVVIGSPCIRMTVGGISLVGAVGLLGYGLYVLISTSIPSTCISPNLGFSKLITNCNALYHGNMCNDEFTDLYVSCSINKHEAGKTAPAGITKQKGVSYEEFTFFINKALQPILNIQCVQTSLVKLYNLTCCTQVYGKANSSICNGVLPPYVNATNVTYPSTSNIAICNDKSLYCIDSALDKFSATVPVNQFTGQDIVTCAKMYLGHMDTAGYAWELSC